MFFLQTATQIGGAGSLAAVTVAFFLTMGLLVYVYLSLAYYFISRKTGIGPAGMAWIPLIGKPLLASRIARMHWWPILVGFVFGFMGFGLVAIQGVGAYFIGGRPAIDSFFILLLSILGATLLGVYMYIWHWKVFEAVGRPGWWVLLSLIPYLGSLIFLVLLGVAAWGATSKE